MKKLETVLHVDDDDDIRAIACMALELIGKLNVVQCSSGAQALQIAPITKPDLFLLDVMMPEMSGNETLALLRKCPGLEETPTIFMTAKADQGSRQALMALGALAVIAKPFDTMTLCDQIKTIWERGQVDSD